MGGGGKVKFALEEAGKGVLERLGNAYDLKAGIWAGKKKLNELG